MCHNGWTGRSGGRMDEIQDMISGWWEGGLGWTDVRMNERTGLWLLIWLGTPIVFDIAEEVPPPPSRAGGISSGIVSLDSLGQNLNSHPFSPPDLLRISLAPDTLFHIHLVVDTGQLMLLRAEGTPFVGTPRLASRPAGVRGHRTMCVTSSQGRNAQTPSTPAGMGVARSVRMKHAHTIGCSLTCHIQRKGQ